MPFVQAKCPECGGMLAVDDSKKAAVCQFCGEAFIVQEAINNYNTYNTYNNNYDNRTTHNYGDGAVVNVYEDKNKDFVIEGGVLKKYQGESLEVVIPEGVVAIDPEVFRDSTITKVTFPSTLKELRHRFYYEKLSHGGYLHVYYGPFFNCSYLEEVVLPQGLPEIGPGAFYGCSNLKSVVIPDSVKKIGEKAFGGTGFTSITIPDSVKNIGFEAFYYCTNLESVTMPSSLETMCSSAFRETPFYSKIKAKEAAERQAKAEAERQKTIVEWKRNGLCQHCGGTFKGLFSSKCRRCGRAKDYEYVNEAPSTQPQSKSSSVQKATNNSPSPNTGSINIPPVPDIPPIPEVPKIPDVPSIPTVLSVNEKNSKVLINDDKTCIVFEDGLLKEAGKGIASNTPFILCLTRTGPKCKIAVQLLKKTNYLFIKVYSDECDMNKMGVTEFPTLLMPDGDNVKKFVDLPAIKEFVDSL